MKYTVVITPTAQGNITEAYDYIASRSPLNAARWVRALYKCIESLETFPRRCGHAREQSHVTEELRQFIFKSHRIVFTVDDNARLVKVVFLRHAKRRALGERDQ